MSKEKRPAFQMYPADLLADANVLPMTMEEFGCYMQLMMICWREVTLSTDIQELTDLCKGTVPSPRVLRCFTVENDRYRHLRLDAERSKQTEWREKCAKGGKRSAHKRKHPREKDSEQGSSSSISLKGSATLQSSLFSLQSSSSEEKALAASQASPPGDAPQDPVNPSGKSERPKDEAYELFCSEFAEHRGIPYRGTKGDFTQLAGLRRQLRIENLKAPESWETSIHNYFGSPQNKYTLADLCCRYDVFLRGALDRFGKPKETAPEGGQNGSSSSQRYPRYVPKRSGVS